MEKKIERKKDFVIVETLKLPLRFVDPNQDWHKMIHSGTILQGFSFFFRMYFHLFFPFFRSMADERKPKNVSKKLPCRKDKKLWYTMWNEYAIYIYLYIDIDIKASARFKTCLKNFWLNLFGKNNTKSRPTIGAENLFFSIRRILRVFFVSSILRTLAKFSVWISIGILFSG